jgi:hypothetical protein
MPATGERNSFFVVDGWGNAVGMRSVHGGLIIKPEERPFTTANEGRPFVLVRLGQVVDISAKWRQRYLALP